MESVAEILAAEQKYFDHVSDHRERMRRALLDAPAAAANAGAAVHLRKDAEARLQRIGEPDDAVAVGRMDDEDGDVLYVGYHTIFDDDSEVLVVNWQAPAAARYFTATHADAQGLARKRSFETTGNVVDAYEDTVFRQLAAAVAELEEPGDALLDDLNRDRTGQMQDIVRTIQAAQFDLIRAPLDEMLIIQGGPGTGKTAVALHRVSWLLFNYRGTLQPEDVLIVGPSPTFTRYTRTVLPSLGDTSVAQRDIGQFHPPVRRGRPEEAEVARLKGDGRMAGMLRRALYDRVGVPADQLPVEAQLDGRPVVFTADEINEFVARSRQTPGTFGQQRQIFRSLMLNSATERARERRLGVRTALDQLIERIWPTFTAAAFLRDLFGSRDRLTAAADEELTARDIALLHRRSADRITDEVWSEADLPLLDYLEALIHGIEQRYGHIVVDEAQDLSPMQLRSIAMRSSTGSMTVVGDIAQSTGLWARDDWDDVLEHLPAQLPQRLAELKYGYRVPRQVFEIAARLLPYAAPEVTAPQVVRDGPADPVLRLTDDDSRASIAVETAMAHASHGRSVAIICPAAHRWAVESELTARDVAWRAASRNELGQGVNLVSPHEAKGLEFDATVVVEPRDIIAEDERGHRLLYVALTRTTRYLAVIGILPSVGGDAVPELEPLDRFELTQALPAPTAIGTATVPSPRTADNHDETPPVAFPSPPAALPSPPGAFPSPLGSSTVPSADEPSVLSSRLAAALSADEPWTSPPVVPPLPDEGPRPPSSESAISAALPTVEPLTSPATSLPVATEPTPVSEPSVPSDGPAPGASESGGVFDVLTPEPAFDAPVSGVLLGAPAPAGSGPEHVFDAPAAEPASGVPLDAPASAAFGSERVFDVPMPEPAPDVRVSEPASGALTDAPTSGVAEPASGVLMDAPTPGVAEPASGVLMDALASGSERTFDVPRREPAFDAPVAEDASGEPMPGAAFDTPVSWAPSAETVSGPPAAEAVPPTPPTTPGSAVPGSGFKLATPLPAFEASVAEAVAAEPVAELGSALPAVPATAPTSAVPATAPTSAVPATAPTSAVPATAPTSAVPATAPASAVHVAADGSVEPVGPPGSAVPATTPTSGMQTAGHAPPVAATATASAELVTASTSAAHGSAVPATALTAAVPVTAPAPAQPVTARPVAAPTLPVPPMAAPAAAASPVAAPAVAAPPVVPQAALSSPAVPFVAASVSAVTPSVAAARARGGSLSAQIVELAAAELAGQIRDNLQPSQWQAVVQRVGELLNEE